MDNKEDKAFIAVDRQTHAMFKQLAKDDKRDLKTYMALLAQQLTDKDK